MILGWDLWNMVKISFMGIVTCFSTKIALSEERPVKQSCELKSFICMGLKYQWSIRWWYSIK